MLFLVLINILYLQLYQNLKKTYLSYCNEEIYKLKYIDINLLSDKLINYIENSTKFILIINKF